MERPMSGTSDLRLDDEQRAAAMAPERFVRVRAGAGTGKTTCLAARVRYLVQAQGVPPRDLCVVTFSKRAAEEIKRRVGTTAIDAQIGTIHSLGYRILQFERMGRPIADDRKRGTLVLRAIKATGCRDSLTYVKAKIGRARAFGVAYPANIAEVGYEYERILHDDEGLWDFDDLVLQPTALLASDPGRHQKWLRRYAHLIVDEAQDTSTCQWDLLEHLVGASTQLYIVGDPGQSIYTWRGATQDGMLESLETRFDQAPFATYTISRNYRSRGQIITTANRVLHGKKEHVNVSQAREEGTPILPIVVGGTWERLLRHSFERSLGLLMAAKVPPTDVVVLGRTHAVLGECEAVCVGLGVPYVVAGGFSFYDRAEIKDVMAYLEYAAGLDRLASLERIYNRPSRYLGRVWLDSLQAQGGWPKWETSGPSAFRWSQRYMSERADELWSICCQLRRYSHDTRAAGILHYVLNGPVGYRNWVHKDGLAEQEESEDNDVDENLDSLVEGAGTRTLGEFVAFVDQCRRHPKRVETAAGSITLSTIHRAKGLEWPIVLLVGLEEDILPHHRGEPEGEERRLYYVAVSRARDALVLALSGDPEAHDVSRYALETLEATNQRHIIPVAELEYEEGDDGSPDSGPPAVALLSAPEGHAGGSAAGDGGDDRVRGADGTPGGGAGHPERSVGSGSPGDGLAPAGGADHGSEPGIPGDVEHTDD